SSERNVAGAGDGDALAGVCATTLTLGEKSRRRMHNRCMRRIVAIRDATGTQNVKRREDQESDPLGREETHGSFKLALVLVRFNHVASHIVNRDHSIMRAAVKLRISNCVADFPIPHRRPNGSASEIRGKPRWSLRGRTS